MKHLRTFIYLCLLPVISFSQPFPSIDWTYPLDAPAFGSAAAADLDFDGKLEIVFSTYTNDHRVHCLNAEDGSVSWVYDIGGCGDVAPVIYDLNGDDTLDVFVNASCIAVGFCLNGASGDLMWTANTGGGDSPPAVADIDKDMKPELIMGSFSGNIVILDGEFGSLNKSIPVDNGTIQTEPALIDVNNDSYLDIIVCNYFNDDGLWIYCFDYLTADTIWTRHDTASSSYHAYHSGAVADLDNDGLPEYVVGRNNGEIIAINTEDGSELWTVGGLTNAFMAISLADLDNDSVIEVIYTNNDYIFPYDNHIGVLSGLDGSLEWDYPTTSSSFRGAAISDVNGNGKLDLVTGHFLSWLRVYEPYTGLVWEMDLSPYLLPGTPYSDLDHGPLLADFDDDGIMEIFVVAGYGTYTPDNLNNGKAFMIEAGTGYCPEWLMFRHDILRTGYISTEEILDQCDTTSTSLADVFETENGLNIFPNPATDRLSIRLTETFPTEVRWQLGDLQGRALQSGSFSGTECEIETGSMPPGMYFIHLGLSADRHISRKILISP